MRLTTVVIGSVVALAAVVSPALSRLTLEQQCQDTIAMNGRRYFDMRTKALSKCRNAKAVSGLPANCSTDPTVTAAIAAAENYLTLKITAKCPNAIAAGTDLGLACKGAATATDMVNCIKNDMVGPRADALIDAAYGTSSQITDLKLRKCQAIVGGILRGNASVRLAYRRACARPLALVPNGGGGGACPDTRALLAFDKSRAKLINTIEARCNDTQVVDPALIVGAECNDTRVGTPAAVFQYLSFDRSGPTTNAIPARTRFSRCLAATAAVQADTAAAAVEALSDLGDFTYGVAAGDATSTSFIAWTRVPTASPPFTLQVALDAAFTLGLQTTTGLTPNPARDNTIKTEVTGLLPSTQYYYRFMGTAPSSVSRTGRIRTAPLPISTAPFSFVFTGDSNAFFKPYSVLEGITREDPDIFLYVGDTIYSDDPRSGTGTAITVADYRNKYAENRDDRALRDLMANVGTGVIWDDHEVTNDFYGSPFGAFGPQIIAGDEAFREWMPMKEDTIDPMRLYRSIKWGDVAEFFLTDNRQYRSSQAYVTEPACLSAGQPAVLPNATCNTEIANPSRTYLGAAQKAWLKAGLAASTAKWKFVMNGPVISNLLFLPYDRWEGYKAERTEMLEFFRNPDGNVLTDDHLKNVVFLSTDIHAAIYNTLVANPGPAGGGIPEIVAGAIGMDSIYRELPPSILSLVTALPGLFPTIQFFDIDRRNYVHIDVSTTQAVFIYRDNAGSTLKTITLTAE